MANQTLKELNLKPNADEGGEGDVAGGGGKAKVKGLRLRFWKDLG